MIRTMQIAFTELEPWERRFLATSALKRRARLTFLDAPLQASHLQPRPGWDVLSTFIYSHVTEQALRRLPRLKLVATRSTGFDHIDLAACRRRKVTVANVPSYGEHTVAEHTFAMMLSLSRNVHKAYLKTTKGDFSLEGLQGFDLKGKTLGVVGAGHIGLHVIKIANGFGMNVLVHDARRQTFLTEVLDFEYVSVDELLRRSDIVTLHVPHMPSTHHLINRASIARMKPGALIINTARGGLVDVQALVEALDSGHLGGAALDVLEEEELIKEERQLLSKDFSKAQLMAALRSHILLHRENVVITPHIAFYSREALQRIMETTIQNILQFLDGHPVNVIK